jgi:hypothetical protein
MFVMPEAAPGRVDGFAPIVVDTIDVNLPIFDAAAAKAAWAAARAAWHAESQRSKY